MFDVQRFEREIERFREEKMSGVVQYVTIADRLLLNKETSYSSNGSLKKDSNQVHRKSGDVHTVRFISPTIDHTSATELSCSASISQVQSICLDTLIQIFFVIDNDNYLFSG